MNNISELVEKLNDELNGALSVSEDGQAIYVDGNNLLNALKALKKSSELSLLIDVTAVEYEERFEMVYHVMLDGYNMVMLKVKLTKENAAVPSITSIWKAADVMEREVYDLMGIDFKGHNDLRRILCPDDFEGHPLRKDFKLDIIDRF